MLFGTLTSSNTTVTQSNRHTRVTSAAFVVQGTWDGATVILECKPHGSSTWTAVTDASWTEDTTGIADVSDAWDLRFSISGGGGSESVEVSLQAIKQS